MADPVVVVEGPGPRDAEVGAANVAPLAEFLFDEGAERLGVRNLSPSVSESPTKATRGAPGPQGGLSRRR